MDIAWVRPDGAEMTQEDWRRPWISALGFMLGGDAIQMLDERGERLIDDNLLVVMNAHHDEVSFRLPGDNSAGRWILELDTADPERAAGAEHTGEYKLVGRSLVVFRQPLAPQVVRQAAIAPERVLRREAQRRRRRAGVVIPLFSIRTASGWGLGEVPDLARFAGWAASAGFSVLQLLPVNDTNGADPSPYAAASAFAIDPVYLSLDACEDFQALGGREALPAELSALLASVSAAPAVDWGAVRRLKQAAIQLAFERFHREEWEKRTLRARELAEFSNVHRGWLDDHALFRAWHDQHQTAWPDWPVRARDRDPGSLDRLRRKQSEAILRVKWTQWQLDRQWRAARREAAAQGVELMGDMPFVVGLDSSDVWAHRELFHKKLHVAAPPAYPGEEAQDWGLPVYDWPAMARDRFSWFRERATRAGALFSLYRIDHATGLYRTYFRAPEGATGFLPTDEHEQIQQGETLVRLLGHFAEVVAEDLGALPDYLRPSLEKLSVPGYRVLRWEKDGDAYREPGTWPESSVATNATHDTDTTAAWYDGLSREERERLRNLPGLGGLDPERGFDDRVRDLLLRVIYNAPSTLALVPLQDALGTRERVNVPGKADAANWTYRAPALEDLTRDRDTTERLARLAAETGRQRKP
jgi:4-alpha-glucanotransferase